MTHKHLLNLTPLFYPVKYSVEVCEDASTRMCGHGELVISSLFMFFEIVRFGLGRIFASGERVAFAALCAPNTVEFVGLLLERQPFKLGKPMCLDFSAEFYSSTLKNGCHWRIIFVIWTSLG